MVVALRQQLWTVALQSERTLLLGTILLALSVSGATGFVLAQYYSVDVLGSLIGDAQECWADWGIHMGRHCFTDYPAVASMADRPDPWEPYWMPAAPEAFRPFRNVYPAAGMLPSLFCWKSALNGWAPRNWDW